MDVKIFFSIILLSLSYCNTLETVNGTIKISVLTTAYCTDTVVFIHDRLKETFQLYKNYLDLELIPWGRTVRLDDNSLNCQFGPADCWSNRQQRCALDMLKASQERQLDYMACEFTMPLTSTYSCAREFGLNLIDLDYCVSSPLGDSLELAAEAASTAPMEELDYVPGIIFNDVPSREVGLAAFTGLRNMVCQALLADPNTEITSCP